MAMRQRHCDIGLSTDGLKHPQEGDKHPARWYYTDFVGLYTPAVCDTKAPPQLHYAACGVI